MRIPCGCAAAYAVVQLTMIRKSMTTFHPAWLRWPCRAAQAATRPHILLGPVALACVSLSAQADEIAVLPAVDVTAAQENSKLDLDTPVTTGSRLGLTPRETPASVTVVDRATIEARGAEDTQEILKSI